MNTSRLFKLPAKKIEAESYFLSCDHDSSERDEIRSTSSSGLEQLRLKRPKLRAALHRIEGSVAHQLEWERIASIVDLCFEFDRETDPEEKENILRTLEEVSTNRPLELPIEDIEEWEQKLKATNLGYARADAAAHKKTGAFLKAYFSLRAKARLATQADVARKSGLSRSYVAVIESGEHIPQQKTLQKLARAFGVDVTALIP